MNRTLISIVLALLLVATFGCKKDEDKNTEASFSAKVEGKVWTALVTQAFHTTSAGLTQIMASSGTSFEQIALDFKGSGTGTFVLNDNNVASVVMTGYDFTSLYSDNPEGEIVITKYDESALLISGTFHFKGESFEGVVYTVTEGKFENIPMTIQ